MMDSRTLTEGDQATLDRLALRWEELRRTGPGVSVDSLAEGRPDLLDALRRRVGDLEKTGVLQPSNRDGSITEDHGPSSGGGSSGGPRRVSARVEYGSLRYHAEGGLGEVFLARNAELNRDVALKFLKRARAADPGSRRRFLIEAEVTGRLEHRGVVPVYALGLDDEGVPCYAMRFIRGETLHDAIEAFHKSGPMDLASGRNLELRALLGRFVAACNTIAYAHSRGVLHRDIKPRNIMIGKYDETLVVDWGLAKRFDRPIVADPSEPIEEEALPPTDGPETHGVVGTPAFMSPEQATPDQAIGPATDVYALGATLYVALTGRAPIVGGNPAQALEDVRKGAFPHPRRVNPAVPRALEAITLKAMANRPEDRYAGALELAADVERWLADEPVEAFPDPWTTRLRRWLSRNRWRMIALAAVILAAIAVPVAVSIVEAEGKRKLGKANVVITQERDAADLARRKSDAVRSFLTQDLLGQAAPEKNARGKRITVEEALDRAAATVAERFKDQPDLESAVRETIGQTYQALGEYEKAAPHLLRVLEIREATMAVDEPDRIVALNNLAALRTVQGRYEEAEPLQRRALEARVRVSGDDDLETMKSRMNLAILLEYRGRPKEAEPLIRRVVEFRTRQLGPDHPDTLRALNSLAAVVSDLKRTEEAVAIHQRILEIRRRTLPKDDPSTLLTMMNLGTSLQDQGKLEEAEAMTRQADEAMIRVLGEDHPDRLTNLNNLAFLVQKSARPVEAETLFRRCLEGRRRMLGDDNLDTVVVELAVADLAWNRGAMDEVIPAYRHILQVRLKQLGDSDNLTLGPAYNLAGLLMDRGKPAEAETILRWVVPKIRKKPELQPVRDRTTMLWGLALVDTGNPVEGEPLIREVLERRRAANPPNPLLVASGENALGHCLARQGRFAEAERLMVASYPTLVGPPAWPALAVPTKRVFQLYRDWGKPLEAARWQALLDDLTFPDDPFAR